MPPPLARLPLARPPFAPPPPFSAILRRAVLIKKDAETLDQYLKRASFGMSEVAARGIYREMEEEERNFKRGKISKEEMLADAGARLAKLYEETEDEYVARACADHKKAREDYYEQVVAESAAALKMGDPIPYCAALDAAAVAYYEAHKAGKDCKDHEDALFKLCAAKSEARLPWDAAKEAEPKLLMDAEATPPKAPIEAAAPKEAAAPMAAPEAPKEAAPPKAAEEPKEEMYLMTKEQWLFLLQLQKDGTCNMCEGEGYLIKKFKISENAAAIIQEEYMEQYAELEKLWGTL